MSKSGLQVIAALILLLAFTANSRANYSGGFSTEAEPYEIGTVADWQDLMDTPTHWDKHFVLTADIDVNGVDLTPIGNDDDRFIGVFDGNDHVIRNVDVNMPETDCVGLFGYVGQDGYVASIGIEDATIRGRNYVGGLLGQGYKCSVNACYVIGSVIGINVVGGLAGRHQYGETTSCYARISVKGRG